MIQAFYLVPSLGLDPSEASDAITCRNYFSGEQRVNGQKYNGGLEPIKTNWTPFSLPYQPAVFNFTASRSKSENSALSQRIIPSFPPITCQ